ncbi:diguanylate phosphodiesterase [Mycobacterium sp. MS1601]|uniref:bifunctional diguanylate cyclase/phosphodiesterase n=1 Tax=Mycobacterium sp. MS1601 TaxID=1936029 RepID=UPI0009796D19|nr:GGDEF domain-containing protein [Mycobacterium sp. MS1601]AQA01126.1 diguanylate phosphodiesterase [Mycobacterium sp. MS1601]
MQADGGAGHAAWGDADIPVDLVRALLGVLRTRLGLDTAWLASFRDDMQVFEVIDGDAEVLGLTAGVRSSLADTCYVRVIDNHPTPSYPITRELGLGTYVGVPVPGPDGLPVGTLCAASASARPELADVDMRILKHTAELVGALIEPPVPGPDSSAQQRRAIRNVVDQRDFDVVFQSVHDVASGKVMGVEALARFPCEPFRPDAFFAQASQLGLGIQLETAIVARVMDLVPCLPDDVFVAVNISPAAAQQAPWTELLTGVDPSRIVLEITEHDAVDDYGALDEVLEACRARGMRVAVDDVGAGFSSFTHVLELEPDFVKIDHSITHNIDGDDARRRLAQAIAEFAGQIGAVVVAEGVETQRELDAVGAAGIDYAQGYHLSRPKPYQSGFPVASATAAPMAPLPAAVDLMGERRFELALAHSPIGMAVVGLDGTFLRTNRALRSILGYGRRALTDLTFQKITHPDDLNSDLALVADCLAGRRRSFRMDKRYIAADGRTVWCTLTAVLVRGPHDEPHCFVSQIVDVTAERMREADLARRAATDQLTAIANRAAGWSRLEELAADDGGYGILSCDIERFKSVNDLRGHHAGDQFLVAVAERILRAIGPEDMVARWGGDEFLVITSTVDVDKLNRLAHTIAEHTSRTPITLADGSELPVTLTVGVDAHQPGDGRTIDSVLERADHDMYRQRRNGRSHHDGGARLSDTHPGHGMPSADQ